MENTHFQAGVVQLDTGADWNKNREQISLYTARAAELGVQYLQFPETSEYIGSDFQGFAGMHEGEAKQFFSELARKYHLYLNCGSITEFREKSKPSNTSLFFAPDGSCMAQYSKMHLFDVNVSDGPSYKESDDVLAGNEIVNVSTPLANFGLSICYDLRFPELYRLLTLEGAQVLCVSANFTKPTGIAHWKTLLQARAIENTCYVLAAGQCGKKSAFEAYGHSMIIDPWGEVIAEMDDRPGILTAEIDLKRIEDVRRQLPCLENRREDIYQINIRKRD